MRVSSILKTSTEKSAKLMPRGAIGLFQGDLHLRRQNLHLARLWIHLAAEEKEEEELGEEKETEKEKEKDFERAGEGRQGVRASQIEQV